MKRWFFTGLKGLNIWKKKEKKGKKKEKKENVHEQNPGLWPLIANKIQANDF